MEERGTIVIVDDDYMDRTLLAAILQQEGYDVRMAEDNEMVVENGLENIKTIGDAYIVVGGLPRSRTDHTEAVADMALGMQQVIAQFNQEHALTLHLRIGIHSGPAVEGEMRTYLLTDRKTVNLP